MNDTITLEIRNDFHNTSLNIRVKGHRHRLTPSQVKRVYSLCGFNYDCFCGSHNPRIADKNWTIEHEGWDDEGVILIATKDRISICPECANASHCGIGEDDLDFVVNADDPCQAYKCVREEVS